ncbi:MAG: cell division protein ZipA [Pseudomonadales bacterium]|nr:cell division protein ZipA [Pseudomonadales bacterium]
MDLRSWLLALVGILTLGVVLDGVLRIWHNRRRQLRMRLEPVPNTSLELSVQEMIGPVRVIDRDNSPSGAGLLNMQGEVGDELPLLQGHQDEPEQQDMFAQEVVLLPPVEPEPEQPVHVDVQAKEPPKVVADDFIVLHVLPSVTEVFSGEMLLRLALGYGLRFGDMQIFHRHEHPSGRGEVLFSMANAVEPGYFDIDTLTMTDCYGVSFFMTLPGFNSIQTYDLMLDTVRRLAHDLGGVVVDQQRLPLSLQLAEHLRLKVQEFERQRLMRASGVSV